MLDFEYNALGMLGIYDLLLDGTAGSKLVVNTYIL